MRRIYKASDFTVFKFEEVGQTFEGEYLFSRTVEFIEGMPALMHHFLAPAGPRVLFGCADIDFAIAQVERGDPMTIRFLGKEPVTKLGKGFYKKAFDIS